MLFDVMVEDVMGAAGGVVVVWSRGRAGEVVKEEDND